MSRFDYSDRYCVPEDNGRQYDDIDLTEQHIVQARYIRSKLKYDNGNMFIEALPRPREGAKEIFAAYNRDIGIVSEEDKRSMQMYEKLSAISLLRQMRMPLPFHQILEDQVYISLLESYRNRELITEMSADGVTMSYLLKGHDNAATNAGCSLLGYSGCGKSSALEILFSNYPQVVMHSFNDDTLRITQIVYLVVTCSANSNFSALYQAVGAAIDRALGYTTPTYENIIAHIRTVGEKAEKVRQMIEKFAIGIIVFDEIQLIDFRNVSESSVQGLMTLMNKTKVAMCVVGTEDAFDKMFKVLTTGRRLGQTIIGHEYCKNRKFFDYIVNTIFSYQWFDHYVAPSDSIKDALYQCTKGIIDQVVGIYMFMQLDYVRAKKKPTVDAQYVINIANKHYPGIIPLLNSLQDPVKQKMRVKIMRNADQEIVNILKDAAKEQEAQAAALMDTGNAEQTKTQSHTIMEIAESIQNVSDAYSTESIFAVAAKVLSKKKNANATLKELTRQTFSTLQMQKENAEKKPADKQTPDALHISMMKDILS